MMAAPPRKTPRTCSQCGNNGHNTRTCTEHSSTSSTTMPPQQTPQHQPIFIFGVNFSESPPPPPTLTPTPLMMRKSMSMNNMDEAAYHYHHQNQLLSSPCNNNNTNNNESSSGIGNANDVASGYASDDALHVSPEARTRKRGIPWTEDEHRLFLVGLEEVGKGDWRGIARNYVKTRTPTQVASHAQKYFLRRTNVNRRRRRSSLFDITTDTLTRSSSDSQLASRDLTPYSSPYLPPLRPVSTKQARTIPTISVPPSSKMASLNLNHSPTSSPSSSTSTNKTKDKEYEPLLALELSKAPSHEESSRRSQSPTFGGFNGNGDSIISVA